MTEAFINRIATAHPPMMCMKAFSTSGAGC